MKQVRRCGFWAALLAAGLTLAPGTARAQDDLGGAKTLYVNASYEEALSVLDKQASATAATTGPRASEIHHYRALCFIALGRTADADQAIAASVSADPFTVPDTSELSPRVASVFNAARARLIPEVARTALAEGRQLMQKGDAAAANKRFEAVTKLLSDPGLAGRADLSDLTLAATAFAELTKAQMAATAAAAAVPATQQPAPATPAATPPVTSSAGASTDGAAPTPSPTAASATPPPSRAAAGGRTQPPPVARSSSVSTLRPPAVAPPPGFIPAAPISQTVPPWQPAAGAFAQLGFTGAVRLSIDATGKVTNAVMDPSVYPPYDRLVLQAARDWTYRPATQDGQPVASERRVEIVLKR